MQLGTVQGAAREIPLCNCQAWCRLVRLAAGRTKMSLLSSPMLPKRYVRPSQRISSKATPETKDECPWHRAITLCSHGEKMVTRSSCPPV